MRASPDEQLYVRARAVLCVILGLLLIFEEQLPGGPNSEVHHAVMLGIITAGTLVVFVGSRLGSGTVTRLMNWLVVPDLIAVTGFTYLFREQSDAFYPVAVLFPITFAIVESKRRTMLVSLASTAAYLTGALIFATPTPFAFVLTTADAAAIPLIALLVARSIELQRLREQEAEQAVLREEAANVELLRRIAELQSVSQITDVIHSSLDFDRVGPVVMDILAKVVGIETCTLFVIDADKSETLFSANVGDVKGAVSSAEVLQGRVHADERHLSCRKVLDHGGIVVMFCAAEEDLARLRDEDDIALTAIASELAVAVENSRLYKLTRRLAITDELTGLSNYRHLQERLDDEIGRAMRFDSAVSLLMIDADDFKSFNDRFGHVTGDRMLTEVATVMRQTVREIDFVARYGGEEFSIVLPETDAPGAFVAAEKVREAVEQYARVSTPDGGEARMTVSIGVCSFPSHAADKEALISGADDALYCAKGAGKNRVMAASRDNCRVPASAEASLDMAAAPALETPADETAPLGQE